MNQVYIATVSTFQFFQERTGGYPQGPILEDYMAAKLMYDIGMGCSCTGRYICKGTIGSLESLARPGCSTGEVTELHYTDMLVHNMALLMAWGLRCTLLPKGRMEWWIGKSKQSFKMGDQDGGGSTAILACRALYTATGRDIPSEHWN